MMDEVREPRDSESDVDTSGGLPTGGSRFVRLSINARERRRMHDLNDALDELSEGEE